MLTITAAQVRTAALSHVNDSNMNSVMVALDRYGDDLGMNKPHILAQFFAHVMHESGDFRFDREIWGPTRRRSGMTPAWTLAIRRPRMGTGSSIVAGQRCN